jgi:hypothetical protein
MTGFNVPLGGGAGLNADWLTHRFDLFERFCYPSVRAQTNTNFKWIVYLDVRTPNEFKKRIARLAEWDRFKPCYVETYAETRLPMPEMLDSDASHLITTTLDNDDAIATDLVAHIQDEFRGQKFEFINFTNGYRLDLLRTKLYRHRVATNPFISLIEEHNAPKTILGCGPHNQLTADFSTLCEIDSEPLWMQVIHDRNIALTGLWGCRRVSVSEITERFPVTLMSQPTAERPLAIAAENVRRSVEAVVARTLSPKRRAVLRKILRRKR